MSTAAYNEELVSAVADTLIGTCMSLEDALQRHDANYEEQPPRFFKDLDERVFECEVCGWWCEISELMTEQTCIDCYEENEDD